jgi:hypothetical protein
MSWEENEEYLPPQQPPPAPRGITLNPNAFSFNPSASSFTPTYGAAPTGAPQSAPVAAPPGVIAAPITAAAAANHISDSAFHAQANEAANGPTPMDQDCEEVSSSDRAGSTLSLGARPRMPTSCTVRCDLVCQTEMFNFCFSDPWIALNIGLRAWKYLHLVHILLSSALHDIPVHSAYWVQVWMTQMRRSRI